MGLGPPLVAPVGPLRIDRERFPDQMMTPIVKDSGPAPVEVLGASRSAS